jgi:hypothetical protein
MSARMNVTITGVKETLREINKVEPELRKEIVSDFKQIVAPVIAQIKRALPVEPPLSGFARSWTQGNNAKTPWIGATVTKTVTAKVDTRKRGNSLAVMKIVMKSPAGAIADMAGKKGGDTPQGRIMIAALERRYGRASRFMWPSYIDQAQEIEANIERVVEKVAEATTRRLLS